MDATTISATVLATVATEVLFHPLDTLITLQQTSTNFRYLLPIERYWRGLLPSVVLSAPTHCVSIVAYRQTKRELEPYLGQASITNYIVSGAVADFASSAIGTPMEIVKGRMQIAESEKVSYMRLLKSIYRAEGVRGFYRGYWVGTLHYLPDSIIYWTVYDTTKEYMRKYNRSTGAGDLSMWQYAGAAGWSTIVPCVATNFISVVQTRQQLAMADEISRLRPEDHLSVVQVARNLIREAGLVGALFKGVHLRLLHHLPSGVLAMVIIEWISPDSVH